MLVTPYFVFVHVPKTGGTWLRGVLPDEWVVAEYETHRGHAGVPEEYARLPVLAFVRNPWDWYVSFWSRQMKGSPAEDRWMYDLLRPDRGFEPFLRTALYSRDFRYRLGRWMRDHDLDFYTATVRDITAPVDGVTFGRFENLRADALRFLEGVAPVDERLRERILQAPPVNTGQHNGYRDYYTPELRELVAERCRPVVRKFGYEF